MYTYICEISVSDSESDDRNRFGKLNQRASGKTITASIKASSTSDAKRKFEEIYGVSNVIGFPKETQGN